MRQLSLAYRSRNIPMKYSIPTKSELQLGQNLFCNDLVLPTFSPQKTLFHNEKICHFKRGPKIGEWPKPFVFKTENHMFLLSNTLEHCGKLIEFVYKDARKVSSSSLLQELNTFKLLFPRSESINIIGEP